MRLFFISRSPKYSQLNQLEHHFLEPRWLRCAAYVSLIPILGLSTYGAFQLWENHRQPQTILQGVPITSKTFQYDRNFSYAPSNTTNHAWQSLFPKGGGFFSHPPELPSRVTISVFHQLHCLDGIHKAYWFLYDATLEGKQLVDDDFPTMLSQSHIRHCIDLIRQALMCHSDRTVEHKDDTGGVSGFGVLHQCVDYEKLLEVIEEWQT